MAATLPSDSLVRPKMNSIEAARGVAALFVLFMHAANLMNVEHFYGHVGMEGVFDFGYVGVDFFFVLSGFIITYVHYAEIGRFQSVPAYLWRRFSRIYPIYWAILFLAILTTTLGRLATGRPAGFEIGFADIPGTVFLLMSPGEPKYVGVAWTLQFEVIFYCAFCLLLINARVGSIIFTSWGVFLLARALGFVNVELPLNLDNAHCFEFLLGVAVGVAARRHPLTTSHVALAVVLMAFAAAIVFEMYGPFGRHAPMGRLVLGFVSAAILATLVGLERQQAIHTPDWLVRIGSASYSIYLGHILFISMTYVLFLKLGLFHMLPEWVVFFGAVVSALFGTMLVGQYVELPLVKTLKGHWVANRSAPASTPTSL